MVRTILTRTEITEVLDPEPGEGLLRTVEEEGVTRRTIHTITVRLTEGEERGVRLRTGEVVIVRRSHG